MHLQISAHSPPLTCNPPGPAFIIHSKLVESISNRHDCTHGHLPGVTKQTFHSRCLESQRLSLSSIAGCYTRFNLDFSFFFLLHEHISFLSFCAWVFIQFLPLVLSAFINEKSYCAFAAESFSDQELQKCPSPSQMQHRGVAAYSVKPDHRISS